jgi:hypothetical protein
MTLLMHNLNVVLSITRQEMTLKMQHIYRKTRSQHVRGSRQPSSTGVKSHTADNHSWNSSLDMLDMKNSNLRSIAVQEKK